MCFNAEVSILTYIVGIIGCILLFVGKHKYIPEGIFFIWVIHMQLIEFFLWNNQPCNAINKTVSNLGLFVNNAEPIVLWLAIILFSKKILPNWMHFVMILYSTATVLYNNSIDESCTIPTPESAPYLEWKWNTGKYYQVFYGFFLLVCILLSIYGLEYGYHTALIFIVSFGISYIIYRRKRVVGSMWCFIAAFCPFLIPTIYKI
jgi:hypothetical protein